MAYDYQRRKEIAREKGFANYNEYRRASEQEREAATARLARTDPTYHGSVGRVAHAHGGRQQIFDTPAGRAVITNRSDVILSQLRRADGLDAQVRVRVVVAGREVDVFKRGGYDAGRVARDLRAAGGDWFTYLAGVVARLYEGEAWAADLSADDVTDAQLVVME